jgi:hypothetical protein
MLAGALDFLPAPAILQVAAAYSDCPSISAARWSRPIDRFRHPEALSSLGWPWLIRERLE